MSENIKIKTEENEEDITKKLNELLEDPLVKGEQEQNFIKNVGEYLKKWEVPLDLILDKAKESSSKMEELKKINPEFESFINHHQRNLSDAMTQLFELISKEKSNQ